MDGHPKSVRVLVVDDEPGVRRILVDYVETIGLDVREASNGEDALACVGRDRIDLVLTDLVMPRMNGLQLARELRRRAPDVKVVVVSGSSGPVDADAIRDAGFAFLAKPVGFTEFHAAVEHELGFSLDGRG